MCHYTLFYMSWRSKILLCNCFFLSTNKDRTFFFLKNRRAGLLSVHINYYSKFRSQHPREWTESFVLLEILEILLSANGFIAIFSTDIICFFKISEFHFPPKLVIKDISIKLSPCLSHTTTAKISTRRGQRNFFHLPSTLNA